MTRILITDWPLHGKIHPHMAIASTLRQRGHEVAFYTGTRFQYPIEKEGFRCFPFVHTNEGIVDAWLSPENRRWRWRKPFAFIALLRAWMLETVPDQIRDLEPILRSWQPDAIITDITMLGPALILHERDHLPVIMAPFAAGCMIPGPDAPVWGVGLPAGSSLVGRVRNQLAQRASQRLAAQLKHYASALRQQYGLSRLQVPLNAYLGTLPLYLVRSAPDFDYNRRDLPASVHYVGPLVWNTEPDEEPHQGKLDFYHSNGSPPDWLADLHPDWPVVYANEGGMMASPRLLQATIAAVAGRPIHALLVAGDQRPLAQVHSGPLPANVHLARWLPHDQLLPRCHVVVSVGGAGIILAALNAGVPVLVVPAESDQLDNAQRVIRAGVGLSIPRRHCAPARMQAALDRLLYEPCFRQQAQRLAHAFRQYNGAERAVELIESVCRQPADWQSAINSA